MEFEMVKIKQDIEILGFNSIYYFEMDKYFYHQPEKHMFWEMVYVDGGTVNAVVDGIIYTLEQGQVIFHKPLELHSHVSNFKDPNNMLVISFTCNSKAMDFFNRKIFQLEKNSKKILSFFLSETKNALVNIPNKFEDKAPLNFNQAEFGSVQLMQGYLAEFLFSLIRSDGSTIQTMQHIKETGKIASDSLVDSIQNYLNNNIHATFRLQDICTIFNISKSYLCRIFKDATGQSLMDYFINLKIKEAKKLIRAEKHNITQISEMLGYSSIHHFTRMFKNITGFSPMSYKKSIQL